MVTGQLWFVYIIQTQSGKLYTGITTDVARRFAEHGSGKGAKFFRVDAPKGVVYVESAADRSRASQREYALKQLTRTQKLALIATYEASDEPTITQL